MNIRKDEVDVTALVPGHHLLPHERWFASRMVKSVSKAAVSKQGAAAIVFTSAARATAIPALGLGLLLFLSTMVLGASASHFAALYIGMRVGVPVLIVVGLSSIFRFEQGGRAAREHEAAQAKNRPQPPKID